MAECTNKEMAQLLHAYELGLLSDADRARVDEHLLVCDHCFEEVRKNSEASRLMRFDPETRRQVREITRETAVIPAPAPRRRLWRSPVPVLIAVGIALVLILKDWRVDIRPSDTVMADENRCAILPFTQLTPSADSAHIGNVIANLLITGLSQSSSTQIVSSQLLYDLTARMTAPGEAAPSDLPTELARQAHARWLLTGSVTQISPRLTLTAQLVELSSGTVKAAVTASSSGDSAIFHAVDQIAGEILNALHPRVGDTAGSARHITDITTASVDAYRAYVLGLDAHRKMYRAEAERYFRLAVTLDSSFVAPYYYLSLLVPGDEGRACLAMAVRNIDRAGPREQYLIRSRAALQANRRQEAIDVLNAFVKRYPDEKEPLLQLAIAQYALGSYLEAVKNLQEAIALDSAYGQAFNQLAYTYDRLGDLESAIRAINRYIELSPNEANPYDSRGDIYAHHGKIDPAIESYRRALQVKPDLYVSLSNLGMMYLFKEDYLRAESSFVVSARSVRASERASARLGLCYLPAYQGQFRRALKVIDSSIQIDRADGTMIGVSGKLWYQGIIYEAMGHPDSALDAVTQSLAADNTGDQSSRISYRVRLAALCGRMDEARAWTDSLRMMVSADGAPHPQYWKARGEIEAAAHDRAAVTSFEKAAAQTDAFSDRLRLAQAYLDFDQPDKAVPILERLSTSFTVARQFRTPESVKLRYDLGRAYEAMRWTEKAAGEYRGFLSTWATADEGIVEIADARARLAGLEHRP